MTIPSEGKLIRIFIGESDRWEGRPLYEAIILAARQNGLAGAVKPREENDQQDQDHRVLDPDQKLPDCAHELHTIASVVC